jgi:dipeptidyl aminopeptidase/acylaminoacyl peptidase
MKRRLGWLAAFVWMALPALAVAQAGSNLEGDWDGALTTPGGIKFRLSLHIENQGGTPVAILVSPDQGNARIPVRTITRDGASVSLDLPAIGGGFKGTLSGDTLTGTWTQGASLPLVFARRVAGAPAPAALKRPQEPKPPLPYRSEDVTFAGPGGITLAGTLTMPQGAGPFQAVVLVHGSGPLDPDEALAGHRPFFVLADWLTRHGVAVLRSDKRGVGKSTGNYATATSLDFAADVHAGLTWLRAQPNIDPRKIGIIGHSEGGMIAPMLASRDAGISFIVLMAGPALNGETIALLQQRLVLQAAGTPSAAVELAAAQNRRIFELVRTATNEADAKSKVATALAQEGVPADRAAAATQQATSPWFRFFVAYDPAPALSAVNCPVLVLQGSLDLQVPAKENLTAMRAALVNNRGVTVKELPGLNHLFQTAKTGAPSEYGDIEETLAPVVLESVTEWIVERTR